MTRLVLALSVLVPLAACSTPNSLSNPTPSATAWAVVNGHEISKDEVEKAYRRAAPEGQQPSEEEIYTAKLNLLSEMIVQELLIEKAAELKVELIAAELDKAYEEAKKNITPAKFEEELKKRGREVRQCALPFVSHVVEDGRLVTGQNPTSAAAGEAVARKLKPPGRRPRVPQFCAFNGTRHVTCLRRG